MEVMEGRIAELQQLTDTLKVIPGTSQDVTTI